jgi:hypothetical protein
MNQEVFKRELKKIKRANGNSSFNCCNNCANTTNCNINFNDEINSDRNNIISM